MGLFFIIAGAILLIANATIAVISLIDGESPAIPLLGAVCAIAAILGGVSQL